MKCNHCGVFNVDGADYCRGCGKQLSNNQKSTNIDLTSNDKGRKKNKNSPLTDMKNKLDKLSYGIIVLTGSLVMACLLPFVYDAEKDYSLLLIDLLPEMDSYSSAYQESMNSAEVGAVLILVFSALGVFLAVRRKSLQNTVLLSILFCVWYIYDTRNDWTGLDISLAEGGYLYCVVPVVIFCMSIKQYSLQKNIKELTLYYKTNGIMEYTADDFVCCPFCNRDEFVRDAGYCRNCGIEFDYGARNSVFISLLVYGILNIFAALICTNSYWITMFELDIKAYRTEAIDNRMCVYYWILLAGYIAIGVLAFKQKKVIKYAFPAILAIMNIIQVCHIWNLSKVLPSKYENSCQIVLIGWGICGLLEVVVLIRALKKTESYFCKS